MFDGTDSIQGNFWDWYEEETPDINKVYAVKAEVGTWQDKKQLTLRAIAIATDVSIAEFMPSGDIVPQELFNEAFKMASDIANSTLRSIAQAALHVYEPLWLVAPSAKGIHHGYIGGNIEHSLSVAKIARRIAQNVEGASVDLCTAGGLLHDFGKLWVYEPDGIAIGMTDHGMLHEHIAIGYNRLQHLITYAPTELEEETVVLLNHIILSHHGQLEYGSPVTPVCIEAIIVNHADGIDASCQAIREAARKTDQPKWTDKVYAINNRNTLKPSYIQGVLEEKTV